LKLSIFECSHLRLMITFNNILPIMAIKK